MSKQANTPEVGTTRTYLSSRSVRGYPYLAEAVVRVYQTKDGRLIWRPEGPKHYPGPKVPYTWYRAGTTRAREMQELFADAPRPWSEVRVTRTEP